MENLATQTLLPDNQGLKDAARILSKGGLVAFATETVYGLGADARNDRAVAAIFAAKNRPSFNPLIVHVADIARAKEYVEWSTQAEEIAAAFWPGPLTMVLPLKANNGLSRLVTAGLSSLAIRIPAHPIALRLLKAFDGPIAAPSANLSGRISPTTAAHVAQGLDGRIEAILDAGPCDVGVESTILGFYPAPTLLREGGVAREDIEKIIARDLAVADPKAPVNAPGQMTSHYAPKAALRLNATATQHNEILLGFGPVDCALNLSPDGNLIEAAANLFHHLHVLDAESPKNIAVSPIPNVAIGRAINDRLIRAAAPRDQ